MAKVKSQRLSPALAAQNEPADFSRLFFVSYFAATRIISHTNWEIANKGLICAKY